MEDSARNRRRSSQGRGLKTGPASVALFAFNRPEQTRQTLAALARNRGASETDLTIFCDGPRTDEDKRETERVQAVAAQAGGFRRIRVVKRPDNLGSALAIRSGLNEMFDEHERVIVLEDDLTTARHFLEFVNKSLDFYAADENVASVCGYTPAGIETPADTYFLPGAHCWGWGTWRRSWRGAEQSARKALHDILENELVFEFDVGGAEPCTLLLARSANGQRDSWVLPWMASAIVNKQLTLYPKYSLIRNDGLEASGLPAKWLFLFESSLADRCPEVGATPPVADAAALDHVRALLMRWRCHDSRKRRLYNRLEKLLPERIRRSLYESGVRRTLRHMD